MSELVSLFVTEIDHTTKQKVFLLQHSGSGNRKKQKQKSVRCSIQKKNFLILNNNLKQKTKNTKQNKKAAKKFSVFQKPKKKKKKVHK